MSRKRVNPTCPKCGGGTSLRTTHHFAYGVRQTDFVFRCRKCGNELPEDYVPLQEKFSTKCEYAGACVNDTQIADYCPHIKL